MFYEKGGFINVCGGQNQALVHQIHVLDEYYFMCSIDRTIKDYL